MKKLVFSLLLVPFLSISQNIFPSSGNVGIGTSTPTDKLEVVGTIKGTKASFESSANGQVYSNDIEYSSDGRIISAGTLLVSATGARAFNFFDFPESNFNSGSSVGLDVRDRGNNTRFAFSAFRNLGSQFYLNEKNNTEFFKVGDLGDGSVYFLHMPKSNSRIVIGGTGLYLPEHKFVVRGSSMIEGNILTNSNIGVGTDSFSDGTDTYRLSVDGAIRATRVKVYTDWADFVFEKAYNLPSLAEVEEYINENGHLMDVPSAKEVEKSGIELGEMNKILLQKVEELTLYLIEKEKQIEELTRKINELEEKIN